MVVVGQESFQVSWVEVFDPCQRHTSLKTASLLSHLCSFSVSPGLFVISWYFCLLLLLNYLLMLFIGLFVALSSLKDRYIQSADL